MANKIGRMDRRELLDRSRQEFQKRWDLLLAHGGHDFQRKAVTDERSNASAFFFDATQVGVMV